MKAFSRSFAALVLLLLATLAARAGIPIDPIIDQDARFHPEPSRRGMVVSQERLASVVGADILAAGGNAVDAAVATGFALAVTLPQAGNIGGGGFMLIYLADQDRTVALDYREMAPAAAREDMFLDGSGAVDKQKARFSLQSTGVPGTVAGLLHAQERYGRLDREAVLEPAIALARSGIRVDYPLSESLGQRSEQLRQDPDAARYFFRADGSDLAPGDLWKQQDLAWSLAQIAEYGSEAFYHGAIADRIVAKMETGGGLITKADLANYRAVERPVVSGTYRGYRVDSMPPPSSGGVHLLQILNIVEGWDLAAMGHNSAAYIHHVAEAMKRAYADRSKYLGDPDFFDVPVAPLTDKEYATRLRAGIAPARATPAAAIAPGLDLPEESPQTTHYSTWDTDGNVVSNTYTLNFSYGNGKAVGGAGFLLNNEMDDFSAKPGVPNAYGLVGDQANAIAARKRPLSSMTPTIVFRDGKPVLAAGSPGGSTIITTVLQTILNIVDFDMNLAEAAASPRFHHQWEPDRLMLEDGFSADTRGALERMGYQLDTGRGVWGKTQNIARDGNYLYGWSDSRWPGGAAVAEPEPEARAAAAR